MSQIDDQKKITRKEQAALDEIARNRPGSTVNKEEPTARFLQRLQRKDRHEVSVTPDEITRQAELPEKYGIADWEIKVLPKQVSSRLWDALGEFVRLSETSLADFISRHPRFLPEWLYRIRSGNDSDRSLEPHRMAWQVWRTLLREAWRSGFHPEFVVQLINLPTTPPGNALFEVQPVWDAQRAVLAMALESWRARFCPKCGSPFVAQKAADKYWPKACFVEQRREKQRASKRRRARKRAGRNRNSRSVGR